jgi:hypothetical protein
MLIQWCLKGIPESKSFGDPDVAAILNDRGLSSTWLRGAGGTPSDLPAHSQAKLSQHDLDLHVNGFSTAHASTAYLSLSAGCVELISPGNTVTHSALKTALDFATAGATCKGYVFLCWVLVSPKPAPELPGFAEEVRNLNLFQQFSIFHHEGEIAAKLYVPARQIHSAHKFDQGLAHLQQFPNTGFVPPERVSNVLEMR